MSALAGKLLERPKPVVVAAGLATAVCISVGVALEIWLLAIAPLGILFALLLIYDYRLAYYLLFFSIPFSIEVSVPGGLTTNLPSEPLMLVLMGCFLISAPVNRPLEFAFLRHPVCLLLGVGLFWALFCTFFSVDTLKSVKFLLAKSWYLVSFLLLTGAIVRSLADLKRILWVFGASLGLVLLVIMGKHAAHSFSFEKVNEATNPFFLNHVIYAATLAVFVPYAVWLWQRAKGRPVQRMLAFGLFLLLLVTVGLAYTRTSWLSLPVALLFLLVLRFNFTRFALALALAGVLAGATYVTYQNNYLLFAPEYEKTVFHEGDLEKHLEATVNFEDVSGMERVYRWVAAVRMWRQNPVVGTGPSTFYPEYQRYTVSSFRTYVSDNPEKSTTHNYFLLMLAEQGIIGLALFVALVFYALLLGQRLYRTALNRELRQTTVAATLSLVILVFHLLLNELIEVDKTGSFFFFSLALLVRIDLWQKAHRELLEPAG